MLAGVVVLTAGLALLAPWIALVVLGSLLTLAGAVVSALPRGNR
jgi:hypothetical protein